MATTSPDEIYSPDAGQQYALTQDLLLMADSVQGALLDRAVQLSGSGAPGSLAADPGARYRDTATGREYLRVGSSWYRTGLGFWTTTGESLASGSTVAQGGVGTITTFSLGSSLAPSGGRLSVSGSIYLGQSIVSNFGGAIRFRRGATVITSRRWHTHGRALNAWVPFNFDFYPTTAVTTSEVFTIDITNDSTSASGVEIWDAQWTASASFVSPQ